MNYFGPTTRGNRAFAGAKGVGRFSCDRLGSRLLLASRSHSNPVQIVKIDWAVFEDNAVQEFDSIAVEVSESNEYPKSILKPKGDTGTVLHLSNLRSTWDRKKLQTLKRGLAKLINPFTVDSPPFRIRIIAPAERQADRLLSAGTARSSDHRDVRVNGIVENPILDVLKARTTSIHIRIVDQGRSIETQLEDRGETIYRIRERNPYSRLRATELNSEIYFLNRKAKTVFARRMGLASVQFGSIFVFRNGFRVYPIGEEDDDFFGLARRKQQGYRRFLGTRDLIGRVELKGVKGINEATSRNQGLIRTTEVEQLIDCIRDKCVRRLERYVVDITWKDKHDKDTDDTSRMMLDESSAKVAQLVARMSDTEGVRILSYNPDLVRIVDERSDAFESSLDALSLLAERTGDDALADRVSDARARIKELEVAEAEARDAEHRAEARAAAAEKAAATTRKKYRKERARNRFLVAASSLDQDTILNLHHQIIIHASDVHVGVRRMMGQLRKRVHVRKDDWIDFLELISFRNSQIMTASKFATKGGYREQTASIETDLVVYIIDYVETVSSVWAPMGIAVGAHSDGREAVRKFRPIDVGIVIDNLVSNATKAKAGRVDFILSVSRSSARELTIVAADDGTGWDTTVAPIAQVMEKGTTTTDGSGLGLYHVKQVINRMGGVIDAVSEPYSAELDGAQIRLRIPV